MIEVMFAHTDSKGLNMNDLVLASRVESLALDSVSSPITRRVYALALGELHRLVRS